MDQCSLSAELVRAYTNKGAALARIVRASLRSRQLGRRVALLAQQRTPVLIVGETGTGKTLLAHEMMGLAPEGGVQLTIRCASLGEAQLAQLILDHLPPTPTAAKLANGTLFIDEVGELSPWGQAVVLRALSDRDPASAPRLVATTSRDLEAMVRAGTFSGELLLRLRGETLAIAPLRERVAEIGPLSLHFMRISLLSLEAPVISLQPDVITALESHHWPGNVRELQNVVMRAVAECADGFLCVDCLPENLRLSSAR